MLGTSSSDKMDFGWRSKFGHNGRRIGPSSGGRAGANWFRGEGSRRTSRSPVVFRAGFRGLALEEHGESFDDAMEAEFAILRERVRPYFQATPESP